MSERRIFQTMDIKIFHFFNDLGYNYPLVGKAALFIATDFSVILFMGTLVYLIVRKYKGYENKPLGRFGIKFREIFFILFTSGIAWLVASALKEIIGRLRPFISLDGVHSLLLWGGHDSFPSTHATFFAALATAIFVADRRAGYIYIFFALVIGISRFIVGVHFPSDVFAGGILGFIIAYSILRIKNKIQSTV